MNPATVLWAGLGVLLLAGVTLAADPTDDDRAPAAAFEEAVEQTQARGRREQIQRFRGMEVETLEIVGIESGLASTMKAGLELSGVAKFLGREKARFYPPTLRKDLERARLFLAREGFPDATVEADLSEASPERIAVVLRVTPGSPVLVGRVDLNGFPAQLRSDVKGQISLQRGVRFRDAAAEEAVSTSKLLLENAGYARSRVVADISTLETGRILLAIESDPGPLCVIREVRIEGTEPDLVRLARRTVGISHGDVYSTKRLDDARDQLRLLGLFRQVRLDLLDPPGFDRSAETAELDLVVRLADRPPRSLESGVGFWSEDLLRVQGRWQHRNLFRQGRGFEVGGLFSEPRREIETSAWWPALFRADLRGEISGRLAWQYEDAFDARRRGGDLSFVYRPNLRSTIRTSLEIERVTITELGELDPDEERTTRETQLRLFGQWSYDNTDDRLDPTRGQLLSLSARTIIPTGLTESDFVIYQVGVSQYVRVLPRTVVALRGNIGWARAAAGSLPAIYRFFAGGATSMRGYRRNRLGPIDGTNTPTGGEAKMELGAELRYPIWKGFRGALFLDSGQVWENRLSVSFRGLEVAAGGGLIWTSPIGPVRIDVGFPLETPSPETDDPDYVIHVLVGHPF